MRTLMIAAAAAACLSVASCTTGSKTNESTADAESKEQLIRQAVERQMAEYPVSNLRDLYKNFFQDFFGPGHLLNDTAAAGNYIRSELASASRYTDAYYEPTGYQGNLYRVNLKVITEGLVPYDVFFDAFVRSMGKIQMMPIDQWKTEWGGIAAVVDSMHLELPNYETDKVYIQSVLDDDRYAIDHSADYDSAYEPHYRIIEKEIFQSEILPLIEKGSEGR